MRMPVRHLPRRATAVLACLALVASWLPASAGGKKKTVAAPVDAQSSTQGSLRIVCPVAGAQYEIDEGTDTAVHGQTPSATPVPLPKGPHTIRVSKEGYLPYSDVFDITAGQVTELEVDMVLYSGKLRVEATPAPVQVQVDEKDQGPAPIELDLSIGEHVVRLSKAGFVEEVRRVAIKTGQTADLSVKLLAVAEVQRRAGGDPIYKKWWFWSIAAAVVAGVVVPTTVLLTRPKTGTAKPDTTIPLP